MEETEKKYEVLTFKDYMSLSVRTLPTVLEGFTKHTFTVPDATGKPSLDTLDYLENIFMAADRIHLAAGVVSETHELLTAKDRINVSEELADKCWYLSGLLFLNNNRQVNHLFDFKFEENFDGRLPYWNSLLAKLSGLNHLIIDSAKKELAYNKNNQITDEIIKEYLMLIQEFADMFKIDMNVALANNINKLYVRFPDKFTQENAIFRNIEAERKVL